MALTCKGVGVQGVIITVLGILVMIGSPVVWVAKQEEVTKREFAVACDKAGGHPAWTGREWLCLPQKGR